MNKSWYHKTLKKWSTRLGLTEWGITLEVVDPLDPELYSEESEEHASGVTYMSYNTQRARVLIANPLKKEHVFGVEHTIVHELLHILINPIVPADTDVELLINRLGNSLLLCEGKGERPKWELK